MQIREVTEHFDLDRVVPFFQPIMDISHNSVWRFECLARLVTPCEQTFLPSEFLHLVERQQSVKRLTETIFSRSANYFRDLNAAWNINISQQDMLNPDLLDNLSEALVDYPNPSRVSLELTASVVLENIDKFHAFASRCVELNIGLYIDHFGATPGNINSILNLPINGIKIAGGLITHLMNSQQTFDFVEHLTQAAHAKGIAVVAVHVEDKATLERVKDLGIRYAQGYYFSKPGPDTKPS
ncbi:EAL domain-containing protein [Aliiglaciecola litoralis]|uniref:EAL domain-containing protein n=1 Tax=Aliiglaciecola litoralis TaxID=582857 RepID=A0ABN1LFK6_9ALTE